MEKEYISIREFASRANISRQRAYKLVNKRLQGYCKTIDSKKCIDISALEEFQKFSSVDKTCNPVDKTHLQQPTVHVEHTYFRPVDKICNPIDEIVDKSCTPVDKIIDLFNKQLEIKDSQLESKDKQIETKDIQLAKKDEQIFELQNIIKSLQEQQVSLTKTLANSQALHAGTIQEHIESKVEKRSLWSWLFRKRN